MQKKKSNSFPLNLGIFLHKSGLSRNGIVETTGALGLTSSYDTIRRTIEHMADEASDEIRQIGELPTAIPAYDNLEFSVGVHELREGDMPKFVSVTTGLVHKGVEIPEEGLPRCWFRPNYELVPTDILHFDNPDRMEQQEKRGDEVPVHIYIACTTNLSSSCSTSSSMPWRPLFRTLSITTFTEMAVLLSSSCRKLSGLPSHFKPRVTH